MRAWRLHETGGRSAHNRVIGASDDGKHKGTPVHYCACPCPVYDHVTNTTKRCGYVVKVEGRGAQRIDAIRHAKKANHYKWWSENVMAKQEKGDPALKGIPPLTTVVELPTWVDPGLKEGGFVKGMSDDEYAVMVADRDEALADYKRNNEIRETYEKKDKKGKKKEEDF